MTVYAGTEGGGVFKSANGGVSWNPSNAGLGNLIVRALAIDPPTTLYAGTIGDGVFKSSNSADNWANSIDGLSNLLIDAIAVTNSGTCVHAGSHSGVFDFATQSDSPCPTPPLLASSVLPASRSVQVGAVATAFATIINAGGSVDGIRCGITQLTGVPAPFTFRATNPLTNEPTGSLNTPVTIAPGPPGQSFVISLTPSGFFCATDITFGFNCSNTGIAPIIGGVNTLLLSASLTPVPDIIAIAATLLNDGTVRIGPDGAGAFAVATSNLGSPGDITVSADPGDTELPVRLSVCETVPATAECLAPPTPSVTRLMNAGETPTFAVFVQGSDHVAFDPAKNRVFVRFKQNATCETTSGTVTRGSTSVAVRSQ